MLNRFDEGRRVLSGYKELSLRAEVERWRALQRL
jgi:hypothetical protein